MLTVLVKSTTRPRAWAPGVRSRAAWGLSLAKAAAGGCHSITAGSPTGIPSSDGPLAPGAATGV